MKLKRIVLSIVHKFVFPFSAISLMIKLSSSKKKYLSYESDPESVSLEERYDYVYSAVKNAASCLNLKVRIKGRKNIPKKAALYVANHKSDLDVLVVLKAFSKLRQSQNLLNPTFVAKKEIETENPKVFYAAKYINSVFIDRQNLRDVVRVLKEEKEIINSGKQSMVVFIEGTRIKEDNFGEFKAAALEPAYTTYCPIVPVVIYGTLNNTSKSKFKYKEVTIEFLEPLKYKQFIDLNKTIVAENLKEKMQKAYFDLKENPDWKDEEN